MEIERINEDTVKFYVSYLDIEKRGFHREEIWYNREKSEQLFWEMMEEVNYQEDFEIEGPLWIQVQAHGKGLEFTVTRARISANDLGMFDSQEDEDDYSNKERQEDLPSDGDIEDFVNSKILPSKQAELEGFLKDEDENFSLIVKFSDIEHIIQLSHSFNEIVDDMNDRLFYYKDAYYLYMEFYQHIFDDDAQEDIISLALEFSEEADETIHILEEYGKVIFENQTFAQIRSYFS